MRTQSFCFVLAESPDKTYADSVVIEVTADTPFKRAQYALNRLAGVTGDEDFERVIVGESLTPAELRERCCSDV